MLAYCFEGLMTNPPKTTDPKWNLLIEGFLLHYRNLIQFFGGNSERHRRHGNDLSTFAPSVWVGRSVGEEEITSLRDAKLDSEFSDRISVCLQHCTVERAEQLMDWDIKNMHQRLTPLIESFKKAFPRQPGVVRVASSSLEATTSSHPVTVGPFDLFGTSSVQKFATVADINKK